MRMRVATLVGVLILALIGTGCGLGTPDGYLVRAQLPRSFNMFPGSPVQILGLDVGIVRELTVEPGSGVVVADLIIDHDVQLPEDVRAVVLTDALLGERYIQLDPPYEGGPTLDPGSTIEEPANVPAEFDELLTALNEFVEGIQTGDLPRLVDNLAEVLDGNGENLGQTLESTRDALGVLQDHDDDLIRLASKLSDVNETLNTRRQELGTVVQDFSELSRVLANQREPLDEALSSLARLSDEAGRLLDTNRELIEEDVATLTRVGQTAVRNLDQVSNMLLSSAELFRHSERVIDREHNWLPLVNNSDDLGNYLLETIQDRLARQCDREGLPTELCDELLGQFDEIVPDEICLPPLLSCGTDDDSGDEATPLGNAVTDALTSGAEGAGDTPEEQEQVDEFVSDTLDRLSGGGSTESSSTDGGTDTEGDDTTDDGDGSILDLGGLR